MSDSDFHKKAGKSIIWVGFEKGFTFIVQFIVGIVLARQLLPSDFGQIGMLTVLVALSQSFVESGMTSALIQRRSANQEEFSTVFIFNLIVSLGFFLLLYLSAPYIAEFYRVEELIDLQRVLALVLIFNSLSVVQRAQLMISMELPVVAKANSIAVLVSGALAVLLAFLDFGVWALVTQALTKAIVLNVILWSKGSFRPSFYFSLEIFKDIFGYGSKILLSGLISQVFNNLYVIFIGRVYSPKELGYYDRARSYSEILSGLVSAVVHDVTFPLFSHLRSDKSQVLEVYATILRLTGFITFPVMTILALLTGPFVRCVLTSEWLNVIPLLQWLCFSRMFFPITAVNMNLINALGRSDLYLRINMVKLFLSGVALLATFNYGVQAMVQGQLATAVVSFYINAYYPGKLLGYGAISQLKELWKIVLVTSVMALIAGLTTWFIDSNWLKLFAGCISGIISFTVLSYAFNLQEIRDINALIKRILK